MENQKQTFMSRLLSPFVVMQVFAILFFSINAVGVSADSQQNSGQQQSQGQTAENPLCREQMRLYVDEQLKDFRNFMDQNFQNKSSTSSLMKDAMKKYEEFQSKLEAKYNEYSAFEGGTIFTEGHEPADCMDIVNNALSQARSFITTKAMLTSNVKQTTALLDKYKEINDKLAVMNKSFLIFKSYLETFAKKVPCYIDKKCNTG